jgi:hypothetical protein
MYDFINTTSWDADIFGQSILAYIQWLEEFLRQYFSGVYWLHCFCGHGFLLMVVNYFNFKGVSVFPTKAYSPLFVNPDTVLALPVSCQLFQLVSWWYP